ncbi:MAG: hypothetical protein ACOX3Y_06690 [Clostridia bacterium]|jgi:predicted anti-sigma-YlaC factor YlaD
MVHFTPEDWKAFAEGSLEGKKRSVMEEHLLLCDGCADKYLAFFSLESAEAAARELHPRFTSNVMKRIGGLEAQRRGNRQGRWSILYYTAAACLTLFFMSAGVFEGFADMIPEITEKKSEIHHPFQEESQSMVQFGWSDRIMNSTVTFLDAIKPKGEEVSD